jgi:polysaccharide export outer membrane protein
MLLVAALTTAAMTAPAQAASEPVEPGDVLQIEVYAGGEKQSDVTVTVTPQRTIVCPLIGSVAVDSSGTEEVGARLRAILARDYFVDPQVIVSVKEHGAKVYVIGEVWHPGFYLLSDAPTLLSVCALAGGFTDYAAPSHAKVARIDGGKLKFINVDLIKAKQGKADDLRLQGGDRIEIPRRLF